MNMMFLRETRSFLCFSVFYVDYMVAEKKNCDINLLTVLPNVAYLLLLGETIISVTPVGGQRATQTF